MTWLEAWRRAPWALRVRTLLFSAACVALFLAVATHATRPVYSSWALVASIFWALADRILERWTTPRAPPPPPDAKATPRPGSSEGGR